MQSGRDHHCSEEPSTLKSYEARGNIFTDWCYDLSWNPMDLSYPQLAEFFIWLNDHKGLSPSTIKGYRSMIALTYRRSGRWDPGADKELSDPIAGFS